MLRIVLVDAVEYAEHELPHKAGGPAAWFASALAPISGITVETVRCSQPGLDEAVLAADAVILSGSPRDAWSSDPQVVRYVDHVRAWLREGKPMLGVCFGHQVMARASGGHVGRNPSGWEVGTVKVTLTPDGRSSRLFAMQREELTVLQSHQDAVLTAPPGASVLAFNAHCAVQALQYGAHQYSVQFHPELSPEVLRLVWSQRRHDLREKVSFNLDERLDSMVPTPEALRLFEQFLHPLRAA